MIQHAYRRVVILGPPGSGKGTQGKLLAKTQVLRHIATGDMFRKHIADKTPLGLQAEQHKEGMAKGHLVPDTIAIKMVLEEITALSSQRGFILDGFPRNLSQAKHSDQALKELSIEIEVALFLAVPREELFGRLTGRRVCSSCQAPPYHLITNPPKHEGVCDICNNELCQRDDDRPQAVNTRFKIYHSDTEPLIKYYQQQGKLQHIHGVGSIFDIQDRLLKAIANRGLERSRAEK